VSIARCISDAVGDYPLSDVLDRSRRTVDEFARLVAFLEAGVLDTSLG
jgi:hypothetical protein